MLFETGEPRGHALVSADGVSGNEQLPPGAGDNHVGHVDWKEAAHPKSVQGTTRKSRRDNRRSAQRDDWESSLLGWYRFENLSIIRPRGGSAQMMFPISGRYQFGKPQFPATQGGPPTNASRSPYGAGQVEGERQGQSD